MVVLRVSAQDLKNKDLTEDGTPPDCYYLLINSNGDQVFESAVIANQRHPDWKAGPNVDIGVYTFVIRDQDMGTSDQGMGRVTVDVSTSGRHAISNGGGFLTVTVEDEAPVTPRPSTPVTPRPVSPVRPVSPNPNPNPNPNPIQPIECCMIL